MKQKIPPFSPVFDSISSKHGLVTAAVFGVIWRHCQMRNGECTASLASMGKLIGISAASVMRHTDTLINEGYIEDTTPDLRHVPHTYIDTGKVFRGEIKLLQGETPTETEVLQGETEVLQGETDRFTVKQKYFTESVKETETKETIETTQTVVVVPPDFSSVLAEYERVMGGTMSGRMRDEIVDSISDNGGDMVIDAIHEAEKSNSRSWRYVQGILRNWKTKGRKITPPLPARPPVAVLTFVPNPQRESK